MTPTDRKGRVAVTGSETAGPTGRLSDERIVKMVLNGTPDAFEVLVLRYQKKALALALNMAGGNIEDARDLAQDAFVKAFRALKTFRHDSRFSTWFYRLLINHCKDFKRRTRLKNFLFKRLDFVFRKKEKDGSEIEEWVDTTRASNPYHNLEAKELGTIIRGAVDRLPEGQRQAFILKNYMELNINEIAEITGLAPGTIKSHLFRATRRLRNELGPILGIGP